MDGAARTIGPYQLVASLGHGGQADVFLAVRHGPSGFSKLIVLKSMRAELEHDAGFREAFVTEAKLSARLHHPNIVQTLDVGDEAGHLYIAMEFLDGQPLSRVSQALHRAKEQMPVGIAGRILIDMLAGLHSAHELQDYDGRALEVIHRDVSPQNVFVTYDGEVKLVDFGIAKAAMGGEQTEVGVIKGKAAYMAPEQARGQAVDRRADIYAAGIVAWELLGDRRLFRGETPAATREKAEAAVAPSLSSVAAHLPPAVCAVIDKALNADRDQRWGTAAQMREALVAAMEEGGVKRATREELGALAQRLFYRERQRLQDAIRDSVTQAQRAVSSSKTPASLPRLLATDRSTPGMLTTHDRPAKKAPEPAAMPQVRHSRFAAGLAVAFLLGVGAVAAAAFFISHRMGARSAGSSDKLVFADASLKLCGSNTVGAELAPALVESFLKRKGASSVSRLQGDDGHEMFLRADGLQPPTTVGIEALGTATAFKGFAEHRCDVGMASRQMNDEEKTALAAVGIPDLRSPATEHVIALDGIAVIVHPNSRVTSLTVEQVRSIFSGEIKDWSAVGGAPGPIQVYARDNSSGTWDTFKQLVLGSAPLATNAQRLGDSIELSDKVAVDPSGIGFIGLAYVRSARALAIAEKGLMPGLPTPYTVASESYPLSRRLYLYTLPRSAVPLAAAWVNFVLSNEGQETVQRSGFVDLSISARPSDPCDAHCPPAYAAVTKSLRRLTVDFRFLPGTLELDSRGTRDLDRLIAFLRGYPGARLALYGFSDTSGDAADKVSLDRARRVETELDRRGVKPEQVLGFGGAMPVTANTDENARERNRRVEVWLDAR